MYESVDEESSQKTCRACGACCRFEDYGHRLYATRLEAAYLVARCGAPRAPFTEDACGYLSGALCTAREGRVLGCRGFFCEEAGRFSAELHERLLTRIKQISAEYALPVEYRPLAEHIRLLRCD